MPVQGRKTVEVELIKGYANNLLAQTESPYPEYLTAEYKTGICDMVQKILTSSGNYKGYTYLHPDKVKGVIDPTNRYEFTRKYL